MEAKQNIKNNKEAERKIYQKIYQKNYNKTKKRIIIRLVPEEYNYFKKIADQENIKITKLIKVMALAQIGKTFYQPKEIQKKLNEFIFLVRNIANNINQIARHSNRVKKVFHENKILSYIKELENEVKQFIKKN